MQYKSMAQYLVDHYQDDFPLDSRPFSQIARDTNSSEAEVMSCLMKMKEDDLLSRVGPIYQAQKMGASTLAAIACRPEDLEKTANFINQFHEVNHNYEREDEINLWFVITAPNQSRLDEVIQTIEAKCEVSVLRFPMVKPYKIDLSLREKINWESYE